MNVFKELQTVLKILDILTKKFDEMYGTKEDMYALQNLPSPPSMDSFDVLSSKLPDIPSTSLDDDFELSESDSEEPAFLQGITMQNQPIIHSVTPPVLNNQPTNVDVDSSISKLRDALRRSLSSLDESSERSITPPLNSLSSSTSSLQSSDESSTGNMNPNLNYNQIPSSKDIIESQNEFKRKSPSPEPSLDSLSSIMQWHREQQEISSKQEEIVNNSFFIPDILNTPISSTPSPLHSSTEYDVRPVTPVNIPISPPSPQPDPYIQSPYNSYGQYSSFQEQPVTPASPISEDEIGQLVLINGEIKMLSPATGQLIELPVGVHIVPQGIPLDPNTYIIPELDDGTYILPDGTQLIPIHPVEQ